MKHLDELRFLADHQKPDILVINEIKIDDKISDQEIAIDGYCVERRDRNQVLLCIYITVLNIRFGMI